MSRHTSVAKKTCNKQRYLGYLRRSLEKEANAITHDKLGGKELWELAKRHCYCRRVVEEKGWKIRDLKFLCCKRGAQGVQVGGCSSVVHQKSLGVMTIA